LSLLSGMIVSPFDYLSSGPDVGSTFHNVEIMVVVTEPDVNSP